MARFQGEKLRSTSMTYLGDSHIMLELNELYSGSQKSGTMFRAVTGYGL